MQKEKATMTTLLKAIEWLKALDTEIRRFSPLARVNGYNQKQRNLTEREWKTIKQIVRQHDLPCYLTNCVSFSDDCTSCLVVYTPNAERGTLLLVESSQFPILTTTRQKSAEWGKTLREIATITHSEQNKQVLKSCGFPSLRPPSHYAY